MFGKLDILKFVNLASSLSALKNLEFTGFKANLGSMEKGIYLPVHSVQKIVRNETVLVYINSIYSKGKSQHGNDKKISSKTEPDGQIIYD